MLNSSIGTEKVVHSETTQVSLSRDVLIVRLYINVDWLSVTWTAGFTKVFELLGVLL